MTLSKLHTNETILLLTQFSYLHLSMMILLICRPECLGTLYLSFTYQIISICCCRRYIPHQTVMTT